MARKRKIDTPPEIVERHSKEQILNELRLMLEPSGGLTAGGFLLLASANPLFTGGEVTPEAVAEVLAVTKCDDLDSAFEAINACFRCFECLKNADLQRLDYFTPEWLADLVGMASQSCTLTWHDALWGMPLVALTHLALATYRRNGGKYERPKDTNKADRWLLEYNKRLKENG